MSQKEIESLYTKLNTSVQLLQQEIDVSYLEALLETGENLLEGKTDNSEETLAIETVNRLNFLYQDVSLQDMEPEEIRKAFQLALLKGAKADQLQANHQMTPDAIGFIMSYLLEKIIPEETTELRVLDVAVGTANLLSTIYNSLMLKKIKVDAEGVDIDDLLLSLAAVGTALQRQTVRLTHQDVLQDLLIDPVDVVMGDLPVGYYPVDDRAKRFKTAAKEGHSYAHHLMIEQSIGYLKEGGLGVFLVPSQLFETEEASALTKFIQESSYLQGMLHLPKELFKTEHSRKSILLIQKKGATAKQAKQVLLAEIPDFKNQQAMLHFMNEVDTWKKENI
ncbi:class I SAM-dependent methyltransferase [Carnobacterium gallinarum]|uniref:class I SAM-dependent methyltransferase n=1 Tax=Carnobacterium gallinarum TaxID=2749 RepID=UPI00054EC80F|nr:class I SAM-dependent methyltransferase [Carnobacterium gallinarum]